MISESSQNPFIGFTYTLVVAAFLVSVLFSGCGYPEVSPKTYELAKALYSATNLNQVERLDAVETLINDAVEREEISSSEADYLLGIISRARDGDWEHAQQETRKLMEDQIGSSQANSNQHTH